MLLFAPEILPLSFIITLAQIPYASSQPSPFSSTDNQSNSGVPDYYYSSSNSLLTGINHSRGVNDGSSNILNAYNLKHFAKKRSKIDFFTEIFITFIRKNLTRQYSYQVIPLLQLTFI